MKLITKYSPELDAENYLRAIFDMAYLPHGRADMKEKLIGQIPYPEIKRIFLEQTNRDEILNTCVRILRENQERDKLNEKALLLAEIWDKIGKQVIFQLESLYKIDWPFPEVKVNLTTIPICPYDFKAREIFVHAQPSPQAQLRILSHELNHFMFYWVYSKEWLEKLGQEKFELLKESVTIFTNPEQAGKPNELPLRELYKSKKIRTIDEAVNVGVEYFDQGRNKM